MYDKIRTEFKTIIRITLGPFYFDGFNTCILYERADTIQKVTEYKLLYNVTRHIDIIFFYANPNSEKFHLGI
uniref:Uncharacterized protein n=1 Tax=Pararge aegeria TaxID=116150 RepID=S4NQ79_9NEOP